MKYIVDIHHGFGDVIHIFPMLSTIKENDENAQIHLLVKTKAIKEAIECQNIVSEITILNRFNMMKLSKGFPFWQYDYGIIAPCIRAQWKSELLLKACGARKIIKESWQERNKVVHRVERNLKLLNKIDMNSGKKYPMLSLQESDRRYARDNLKIHAGKENIALCLGGNYEILRKSGKTYSFDVKRWPIKYYARLIKKLSGKFNIVLIGGEKDSRDFWENQKLVTKDEVSDFMGKTTFLQSGAIMEKCFLAVGNDTGMIHVAAALGIPTMAVFCSTDPRKVGAYAENAIYIEEYLPCKYCYLSNATYTCKNRECLTQIKPERMYDEIMKYYNEYKVRSCLKC